jgi:hypothetical protein
VLSSKNSSFFELDKLKKAISKKQSVVIPKNTFFGNELEENKKKRSKQLMRWSSTKNLFLENVISKKSYTFWVFSF